MKVIANGVANESWKKEQEMNTLQSNQRCLILSRDGCCHSLGHNMKYFNYSLYNQDSKKILATSFTHKTEIGGCSNQMEKAGLVWVLEEGDEILLDKWTSIVFHIQNKHQWTGNSLYHQCSHSELSNVDERCKNWLVKTFFENNLFQTKCLEIIVLSHKSFTCREKDIVKNIKNKIFLRKDAKKSMLYLYIFYIFHITKQGIKSSRSSFLRG